MEVTASFAALVPIVVGLVQVVKVAGFPSRFAGILAIALGVLGAALIGGSMTEVLLQGIVAGLSASGLYSASRSVVEG